MISDSFWAAGVYDIWAVDQYDKWKYKFGLALYSGIGPFIGRINWMKVWWTNSNPRLILSYYLDTVAEAGFMPLISQNDPVNENIGLANGHTLLRRWHDPCLLNTLQHRRMNEKMNVMPEIGWSQLRHRFTPGFEDVLDIGVKNGWHDPSILLQVIPSLVFRWVFIPWLQKELNNTAKRADRNKVLPHGAPNDMYAFPEKLWGISVDPDSIAHVRNLYAPPDHQVFQPAPNDFAQLAAEFYVEIGQPPIIRSRLILLVSPLRRQPLNRNPKLKI
ncbi:hypothetical protein B0H14DRAFT_3082462 [Mycena olivaceomarginata]|nr:hypothetical protein B0H14DRAFT_3082462 [Mycena olivaceomarginata]